MTHQPSGEVVFYQRDGVPALEVRLDADTVWLSQQRIAALFPTSRTNVVEHIRNVYDEDELDELATCRKFRQVRTEGTRQVLDDNLDLIALADATGNSAQARKPGRPCGAPNYGLWRHGSDGCPAASLGEILQYLDSGRTFTSVVDGANCPGAPWHLHVICRLTLSATRQNG